MILACESQVHRMKPQTCRWFLARPAEFVYKLVKCSPCVCVSVWMLTRVEHIVTGAHRDL